MLEGETERSKTFTHSFIHTFIYQLYNECLTHEKFFAKHGGYSSEQDNAVSALRGLHSTSNIGEVQNKHINKYKIILGCDKCYGGK